MARKFEWDPEKNHSNSVKHGVWFEDAVKVFDDVYAIYLYDKLHSYDEDRFTIIGLDIGFEVMTVCHCYRENDTIIRIISARKATNTERKLYERGVQ